MSDAPSRFDDSFAEPSKQSGLTRRQLVTAGAWAAPVILLATAAPASASSQGTITALGQAVPEAPGTYLLLVNFSSTYTGPKPLTYVPPPTFTPSGGSFIGSPSAVFNGINGAFNPRVIGTVTNVAAGTQITITYSVPTGTTPATELVTVTITVPSA